MKKILITTFILACITLSTTYSTQFATLKDKVNYYHKRYNKDCCNEKITDNYGNGFDSLYGTRNMKTILYGIAYRGGANNFYHKTNKRDNHNPLPDDGLTHLCKEGFDYAVYLYGKNFNTAKKIYINHQDTLNYIQNSAMNRKTQREIMQLINDRITNPTLGPIYLHCWNGWHQSGYVAAIILMQFCGITNAEARTYWEENTDGAYKKFENVKKMLANFEPFDDINIDDSTRNLICPCIKK